MAEIRSRGPHVPNSTPDRPTEAEIRRMVHLFYDRVREDPLLGPVFENRIDGEWGAHLERMVAFWTSVLLASGQYLGNPLETHRTIPGIGSEHFDRWLELFREVVHEVFVEHVAGDVLVRAERMRVVLERHPAGVSSGGSATPCRRAAPPTSAPPLRRSDPDGR